MEKATVKKHTDPHTGEKIETNHIVFSHAGHEMPFAVHRFIKEHMEPINLSSSGHWGNKGSRQVSMKYRKITAKLGDKPTHELHINSVKISR